MYEGAPSSMDIVFSISCSGSSGIAILKRIQVILFCNWDSWLLHFEPVTKNTVLE